MLLSLADVKTVKIYWAAMTDSTRSRVDNSVRVRDFQDDLKENISSVRSRLKSADFKRVSSFCETSRGQFEPNDGRNRDIYMCTHTHRTSGVKTHRVGEVKKVQYLSPSHYLTLLRLHYNYPSSRKRVIGDAQMHRCTSWDDAI